VASWNGCTKIILHLPANCRQDPRSSAVFPTWSTAIGDLFWPQTTSLRGLFLHGHATELVDSRELKKFKTVKVQNEVAMDVIM
jgi:hypothetical protein